MPAAKQCPGAPVEPCLPRSAMERQLSMHKLEKDRLQADIEEPPASRAERAEPLQPSPALPRSPSWGAGCSAEEGSGDLQEASLCQGRRGHVGRSLALRGAFGSGAAPPAAESGPGEELQQARLRAERHADAHQQEPRAPVSLSFSGCPRSLCRCRAATFCQLASLIG
jgi:hypothetical protein